MTRDGTAGAPDVEKTFAAGRRWFGSGVAELLTGTVPVP